MADFFLTEIEKRAIDKATVANLLDAASFRLKAARLRFRKRGFVSVGLTDLSYAIAYLEEIRRRVGP